MPSVSSLLDKLLRTGYSKEKETEKEVEKLMDDYDWPYDYFGKRVDIPKYDRWIIPEVPKVDWEPDFTLHKEGVFVHLKPGHGYSGLRDTGVMMEPISLLDSPDKLYKIRCRYVDDYEDGSKANHTLTFTRDRFEVIE